MRPTNSSKRTAFRDNKVVTIAAIWLPTLISKCNWRRTITREGTFSAQQLALFGNTLNLHQSFQQILVHCSWIISPTVSPSMTSIFSFQFSSLFPHSSCQPFSFPSTTRSQWFSVCNGICGTWYHICTHIWKLRPLSHFKAYHSSPLIFSWYPH